MDSPHVLDRMSSACMSAADVHALLDIIPVGIMWFDGAGHCSFVNAAFTGMSGYVLEDLSPVPQWLCKVCPEPAERESISRWYRQISGCSATPPAPLTVAIVCKNGAVRHVAIDARCTGNSTVVTCTDATELEQLKKTEQESAEIFRATLEEATEAVLEKEKAEGAFHDAAELLQKTFASLNEAVFVVQAEARTIQDVNVIVEKMFGYSRGEIIGKPTSCLHLNEQMYLHFCNNRAKAYGEKGYFETTWQMKRKDGSIFDSEHCVTPIFDNNGGIVSHVCVVRDITERIRAEKELRKLALEQGVILDNACIGITLVKNRTFIWTNKRFEEMFGYTREELSGLSTRLVYPSVEMFTQTGKDAYAAITASRLYVTEFQLKRKDGTLFWTKCYCKAIDADMPDDGTIWIVEDIQGRREAEQALAEKSCLLEDLNANLEQRIEQAVVELRQKDDLIARQNRLLLDLAPEAIVVFDTRQNRIVDANDKAEELFGCSREELFTSGFQRFYLPDQPDGRPPEITVQENMVQVLAGNMLVIERAIRSAKGAEVVCEVRLVRVPSPHQALIRASFFDITERIRTQEKLAQALAGEHLLNEEQRQFMGLISHELRTPLAIIDGSAQLLVMTACKDSDCLMQAQRILGATKRLNVLIHNCFAEERLCTSGWIPAMVRGDIGRLVLDVIAQAQAGTTYHEITCCLGNLPAQYAHDPMLMRVMLGNLLDNAIKYSPDGGCIRLRAWSGKKRELFFQVSDQGVGIAPDQIEKVFSRFYRAWQIPDIAGAGLGLHIVKRIAELHGGTVTCSSTPGQGSVFTVKIRT